MLISTVGIVGAGTIGRGVAQSFAESGYEVVLVDVSAIQLDAALEQIESDLILHQMFRPAPGDDSATVLNRIRVGTDLALISASDFVVENVTEDWEVKRAVYAELDVICKPGIVFGVNTSAVPITRAASATTRASEVLGVHFMNPVPLMPTVEVVRGLHTSEATLGTTIAVLDSLGKRGIVVQDSPGFVINRVLMLTINEAIFCVQDQVATAQQVDDMFRTCLGHKMGPLETGDLIGLDTVLGSITVMYESFRDSKFRPAPLLVKMVDGGHVGRKSGRGFYTYD